MTDHDGSPAAPRAVEAGPALAFVCDEHGSIVDASATAAEVTGVPVAAMRGRLLARLGVSEDEAGVVAGLAEARRSGASKFSMRVVRSSGSPVRTQIAAWTLDVNGSPLTLCTALASDEARRQAEERARRLADTQKVIATILELALGDHPLEDLLQRTLDLVLWIPWLSIERKGAILLVEDEPSTLVMKASRGLEGPLLSSCGRVPFGTCLCGHAAATRTPVYAADLDERHTRRYPGMIPHGHYCVPICAGDATLGVINTYLAAGHEPSAIDLEFLMAVADTLAGVLLRRRVAGECDELRRLLDHALRQGPLDRVSVRAAQELTETMSSFLASAQEIVGHLPPNDHLREMAEKLERAARRGIGLARDLEAPRSAAK